VRWLIAGLLFACAVILAIGTAAIRADNTRMRYTIELGFVAVEDRKIEYERLSFARLDAAAPEHLAELHWAWLRTVHERRQEQLQ
jgi:hypothetical protein